ncbi:hypothetical protein TanjilG_31072 [Lupinus angustifolius]|uniref:Transcription factor CBF/NF-Y/archaeal histone domain-containing protein n=1 Tax=Lupinus angustifolius TaxID=3871 RepID=A0A4P1R4Y5_LUPAN|nr:PREDICTED: nuclear transcription factor Y subunit B-9-like [Lupinus angustifolius]OIW01890.1 hypothetical protein TanjilG_31072 [Lupinus angustifolius]
MASPNYGVREQDQYMPIANVIRIMRRILPTHAKISDDAKETIQECVSEYISFITAEANDRCQREQRKTVTAEDVLFAMGKLGFDDYVGPLSLYLQRYRESEGEPAAVRRVANYGSHHHSLQPPPPPPQQQPLGGGGGGVSYGSGFLPSPVVGMFDPSTAGMFYRDDGSAGSGNNSIAAFDPFAHIKRDRM